MYRPIKNVGAAVSLNGYLVLLKGGGVSIAGVPAIVTQNEYAVAPPPPLLLFFFLVIEEQ